MAIGWAARRRWTKGTVAGLLVVTAVLAGFIGFLAGSAANPGSPGSPAEMVTVTAVKTISIPFTTTHIKVSTTLKTSTKIYTKLRTVTVPPEFYEVPLGELLSPDERIRASTELVVESGRYYYVKVKVTNVGNETLHHVLVIFIPYRGDRPIWSYQNVKIFTDVGAGETYAHKFRIPSPSTRYKLLVYVL